MKRLHPAISFALFALAAGLVGGCGEPDDVIAVGEVCTPEADGCPEVVDLERDQRGRNGLDWTLQYRGDEVEQAPTVAVRATTEAPIRARPDGPTLTIPDVDQRPVTADGRIVLYDREFSPAAGDEIRERLDAFHLTVAHRVRLEVRCLEGDCDHRLEYLHFNESLECIDDADCSRTEFCEDVYARCADCLEDADCEGDQQCHRDRGRCNPGAGDGCQTASGGPGPAAALALVVAALAAARFRRRAALVVAAAAVGTALLALPVGADADTGASMNAGAGMRVLTGEAGEMTRPGWGLNVNQQLRWRRVGTRVEISTHSFRFDEAANSDQTALTGYGISFGPRIFFPLEIDLPFTHGEQSFELFGALDYTHFNVAENRLARTTGLDLRYHAAGPTAGISWRWGGLSMTARTSYDQIFGWPGGLMSFGMTVGIGP